jgi:hypothetical protein
MDAWIDCNEALELDQAYSRAFLTRARALSALEQIQTASMPWLASGYFVESVVDYGRYLSTNPTPKDHREVRAEMESFQAWKTQQQQKYAAAGGTTNDYSGKYASPHTTPIPTPAPTNSTPVPSATTGESTSSRQQPQPPQPPQPPLPPQPPQQSVDPPRKMTVKEKFEAAARKHEEDKKEEAARAANASASPQREGRSYNAQPPPRQFQYQTKNPQPPPAQSAEPPSSSSPPSSQAHPEKALPKPPPSKALDEDINASMGHYIVLGLGETATERDIKLAYRKLGRHLYSIIASHLPTSR